MSDDDDFETQPEKVSQFYYRWLTGFTPGQIQTLEDAHKRLFRDCNDFFRQTLCKPLTLNLESVDGLRPHELIRCLPDSGWLLQIPASCKGNSSAHHIIVGLDRMVIEETVYSLLVGIYPDDDKRTWEPGYDIPALAKILSEKYSPVNPKLKLPEFIASPLEKYSALLKKELGISLHAEKSAVLTSTEYLRSLPSDEPLAVLTVFADINEYEEILHIAFPNRLFNGLEYISSK